MRLAAGSPQADLQPGRLPTDFYVEPQRTPPRTTYVHTTTYTHMYIRTYIGFQTEIHFKPRAYPQAELRPGRLPTSRPGRLPTSIITTREPTHKQNYDQGLRWLAGWRNYDQGTCGALGLGGWLAGGLKPREAQRGPERRNVDRTSLSCAWLEAPHKQIYKQGGSPHISLHMEPQRKPRRKHMYHSYIGFQTEIHSKPRASPQAELRPGKRFYRVQVSVHALVRFIATVHLSDTNVPTGWSRLGPVSQSDRETRVS